MKYKIVYSLLTLSLLTSCDASSTAKSENNLIQTVKKSSLNNKNSNSISDSTTNNPIIQIPFRKIATKNTKSNKKQSIKKASNYARIMIRLKPGVDPQKIFNSIIKTKGVDGNSINLVKSFKLVKSKRGLSALSNKKQSIMVLESYKMSAKKLIELAKTLPGVDIVEESKPIKINLTNPETTKIVPNDTLFSNMWGLHNDGDNNGIDGVIDADIDAPEAWVKHKGYSSIVVGNIDTGIDYYHPDLKPNIWINKAEINGKPGVDDDNNGYVDDYYGIDTANGDSDPYDDNGHGTHTAGTIGAAGNNNKGIVGVNWRVKIASCKFLNADGQGTTDGAVECINYFNALKDAGVNIVATNNSWGGGDYSSIMHDAIAEANDRGINFVAAAGNESNDNDENPSYPASYDLPNVISVAATDANDELAYFSNYGETSVDLAAPGDKILSTYPSTLTCTPNDDYTYFNEDFENGIDNWDMVTVKYSEDSQDIPKDHWKLDNSLSNSGSYSLSDSPNSNYTNDRIQIAQLKKGIDLSDVNTKQALCLSLKIKGQTEQDYDRLIAAATPDDGDHWYVLGQTSNNFDDWSNISFALTPNLHVENLKFAIIKINNESTNYEGYNIDDIKITTGSFTVNPRYAMMSGTSMATPHVTGAIAFISKPNDHQSAADRKKRILNSVDHLDSLEGKVATAGRLNINNIDINNTKHTYNNDKTADILWRKDDGKTLIWYMKADGTHSSKNLGTISNHYKISAIEDLDGNGIADILWRKDTGLTKIWHMQPDGTHISQSLHVISTHYQVVSTSDLNGDGIADILWRKDDGKILIWYMKADGAHTTKSLGTITTHYKIASTSDLNGDGIADILWRKDDGKTLIWYMKADGTHTTKSLGTITTHYKITSTSDLNGDGIADILWRKDDGKTLIWYMKADGTHTTKSLGTISTSWHIIK